MADREVWDAIAVDPRDNVAVMLRDVAAGDEIQIRVGAVNERLAAVESIPLGHKIARRPIECGTQVLKYGEVIASARTAISAGQHVHVHNVASNRARARPAGQTSP